MEKPTGGGPRALASVLPRVARTALGKRGFGEVAIVSEWPAIVGATLAAETVPLRLAFPRGRNADGTLHVRVSGTFATELQHLAPLVIERINTYFGFGAIARLALTQGPVVGRRRRRARTPPPSPEQEARLEERLAGVEPGELREALARLGRALHQRAARSDEGTDRGRD